MGVEGRNALAVSRMRGLDSWLDDRQARRAGETATPRMERVATSLPCAVTWNARGSWTIFRNAASITHVNFHPTFGSQVGFPPRVVEELSRRRRSR